MFLRRLFCLSQLHYKYEQLITSPLAARPHSQFFASTACAYTCCQPQASSILAPQTHNVDTWDSAPRATTTKQKHVPLHTYSAIESGTTCARCGLSWQCLRSSPPNLHPAFATHEPPPGEHVFPSPARSPRSPRSNRILHAEAFPQNLVPPLINTYQARIIYNFPPQRKESTEQHPKPNQNQIENENPALAWRSNT